MIHPFDNDAAGVDLPAKFTYPFLYRPHPLCVEASRMVREHIDSDEALRAEASEGKMFGVMVVRDSGGAPGFIAAFSGGLLAAEDGEGYFVPPVYDLSRPDGYFLAEQAAITELNRRAREIENSDAYAAAKRTLAETMRQAAEDMEQAKRAAAESKRRRKSLRDAGGDAASLDAESRFEKAELHRRRLRWQERVKRAEALAAEFDTRLAALHEERRRRSAALQMRLFRSFRVLNARGEQTDLCEIFAHTPQGVPPAGTGECAAPKLLQYAYRESLTPIAMAEFWYGRSPREEIRRDGEFYPACRGKCAPLLAFMLQGLEVDDDPLASVGAATCPRVLYEDEWLLAVDKPSGMLSVQGKSDAVSVQAWAQARYPEAECLSAVHRLDMDTSGIMLLAKDSATSRALQAQFINRTVVKRYTAVLDGTLTTGEGTVALPLSPDYANRPCSRVDFAGGKRAVTRYRVVERMGNRTRVEFSPVTGRTHQLRIHAAHPDGLNAPIAGDRLYGRNTGCRLLLHASALEFVHPATGERMKIECPAEF